MSSSAVCPLFNVKPYSIFFVDTKNVWGGVIISIGFFLAIAGRRMILVSNFIINAGVFEFVLMCVFSSTFMKDGESWVVILTCTLTAIFSLIMGGLSVYFIKFGGSVIGAVAGFLFGILINTAWFYLYESLILTYCVCGALACIIFVNCLFRLYSFNATTLLSTSFIGSYLLLRGIAVYVGEYPNEIILLGQMKRGNISKINP